MLKIVRITFIYYSLILKNILHSFQNFIFRDDLETIKKDSTSDPNAKSAASLYIRSCLVRDMGFPARMVDSLIKYESNILNTDIQQIQPK